MIHQKTVLVLGAGASHHLGFPLGKGLVDYIAQGHGAMKKLIIKQVEDSSRLERFLEDLKACRPFSIDEFLEHRPEYMEVGKAAIAWALIQCENPAHFGPTRTDGRHWYDHLFSVVMRAPFDKFHENKVSVITFNYDRSFEQFLFTKLQRFYGVDEYDAQGCALQFRIIHVHGQLGHLPWQDDGEATIRAYEEDSEEDGIRKAVPGIKIITDKVLEESAEFTEAKRLISEAERIFFFGFGYHPDNMRRLGFDDNAARQELARKGLHGVGSGYGLTSQQRLKLMNTYNPLLFVHIAADQIMEVMTDDEQFLHIYR